MNSSGASTCDDTARLPPDGHECDSAEIQRTVFAEQVLGLFKCPRQSRVHPMAAKE